MSNDAPIKDHAAITYRPGPFWDHECALGEQSGINGHLAHLWELMTSGVALQAGPFHRESDLIHNAPVGLVVFATNADEARRITARDPAVRSGVMEFAGYPWYP